jgi:DNA helicase-2/ATP-dependent DNA helicase PcrA
MQTVKIFGPPGTGKTTRLVQIVLKELEKGVSLDRIAYLAHTNAARDEAVSRIEIAAPESKGKAKHFRTIHSAACGALKIRKSEIWSWRDNEGFLEATGYNLKGSFDPEDMLDYDETSNNAAHDLILHAKGVASHRMETIWETIANMPDHPLFERDRVIRFLEAYEGYKNHIGKVDFIDMLEGVRDMSYEPMDIDVLIIDEAQDLSKRQWEVALVLGGCAQRLYIAGDDDQAIYAFIGADEYGFLDFQSDKDEVLHTSYRCSKVIGERADQIIRSIPKRHEKHTIWGDHPGSIEEWSQNETYFPWDEWAEEDRSTMVLCRHKKQVRDLRKLLYGQGIPHTVKGEAPNITKEARILKGFFQLRGGESIPAKDAAAVYGLAGMKDQANTLRDRAHRKRDLLVSRTEINLPWDGDWVKTFAKTNKQKFEFEALRRMLNRYDLEVIGKTPRIDLSTYHASKGREADRVVLFTDVYKSVWKEQEDRPEGEIRLAYVGLTRARSNVIIVTPRTRQYMRALVERGTK